MSGIVISTVECAPATATRDISVEKRTGSDSRGRQEAERASFTQIRNRFESELALKAGDLKAGKARGRPLKKDLPGVTGAGRFIVTARGDKLLQHSGLLCADWMS